MSEETSHKASCAEGWVIPEGSEAELSLLRSELDACRAELERRRERIEELEAIIRSWQFEQTELPEFDIAWGGGRYEEDYEDLGRVLMISFTKAADGPPQLIVAHYDQEGMEGIFEVVVRERRG